MYKKMKKKQYKDMVKFSKDMKISNLFFSSPVKCSAKNGKKVQYVDVSIAGSGGFYSPNIAMDKIIKKKLEHVLKSGPIKKWGDMNDAEKNKLKQLYEKKGR